MFVYVERGDTIHQIDVFSDDDRAQAVAGGVDVTEAFATVVEPIDFATRQGVAAARLVVEDWRTAPALNVVEALEPMPALDTAPVADAPVKRGPGRPSRKTS